MDILFTFPLKEHQEHMLKEKFTDVTFHFAGKMDQDLASRCDVLVTYGSDVTPAIIHNGENLKWIMVASAGLDKMPLQDIEDRGILVTNVRGIHKTPMAESILAHILSMKRGLPEIYRAQQEKRWQKRIVSSELRGSTALILGPGAIGSEVGRLLHAFGVKTIGCNRSGNAVESLDETIVFANLVETLPKADYVISLLPETNETKGLLTKEHFKAMKPTAVFMNFGRGSLVSEEVLIEAVQTGEIAHAVLDVFIEEPLPEGHPFWSMETVTVSPHVSSHSSKYVERALEIFVENLETWKTGRNGLLNVIEPGRGY